MHKNKLVKLSWVRDWLSMFLKRNPAFRKELKCSLYRFSDKSNIPGAAYTRNKGEAYSETSAS